MSHPHAHAPAPQGGGGCRPRWSDAAVETLAALWRQGDLSAAEIARRLGVTRNAVLGKIHRLGLSQPRASGGGAGSMVPRVPRAAPRRRPPRPPQPPKPAAALDWPEMDVGPGLVERLENLPPHACRWPIGEPKSAAFRFCGRPAGDRVYCPPHWRLAHRAEPARPRRRRRAARG